MSSLMVSELQLVLSPSSTVPRDPDSLQNYLCTMILIVLGVYVLVQVFSDIFPVLLIILSAPPLYYVDWSSDSSDSETSAHSPRPTESSIQSFSTTAGDAGSENEMKKP